MVSHKQRSDRAGCGDKVQRSVVGYECGVATANEQHERRKCQICDEIVALSVATIFTRRIQNHGADGLLRKKEQEDVQFDGRRARQL